MSPDTCYPCTRTSAAEADPMKNVRTDRASPLSRPIALAPRRGLHNKALQQMVAVGAAFGRTSGAHS